MCDPVTSAIALGSYAHDEKKRQENEAKRNLAAMKAEQDAALAEMNKPDAQTLDPIADKDAQRKKRLASLRGGLASTVKTSPLGTTTGAAAVGKMKLGQ